MKKGVAFFLWSLLASVLLVGCGTTSTSEENSESGKAAGDFKLKKDVELICHFSAGGGSDLYARMAADIIQKNGWCDQPIMVVNKTGGGGSVGDTYTFSKKGSSETITTYVSAQITSAMLNKTEVTYKDLTPICNLAMDEYLIGVNADSPYQTAEDLMKASKENPGSITIGGSGKGTEDELVTGMMNKYGDAQFEYVSYNSSSEVMSAMLGGHITAGIYNPNECLSQAEAGQVSLLAAFGPERVSILPEISTFTELGYPDIVFQQFRGIFGAPEMSEEAVTYWADVFKKVTEDNEWKEKYLDSNGLTSKYIAGEDFETFLGGEAEKYETIFKATGALE